MKKIVAIITCLATLLVFTGVASAAPTNPGGYPNFYWSTSFPTLGQGAHNSYVYGIQVFCTYESSRSPEGIDGIFGPNTKASVQALQRYYGVTADGIVGPITWGRMHSSLQNATYDPPLYCSYYSPHASAAKDNFMLVCTGDWVSFYWNGSQQDYYPFSPD